ncbi:hypothetical protein HNQ80_000181 [Anaerosolibacter carboniphilus]|uniref:Uncharacterized protein n=1 Tax=Anaerosolibacter carboniphilus TaxID=1417629 RepID=A0A841KT72_9FIRM|nr:hypothetical protein [Anaerosolibacter carboniphilus]MBB6214112.1 hypothetical protein [Anaerosolibacter carboniphilus]
MEVFLLYFLLFLLVAVLIAAIVGKIVAKKSGLVVLKKLICIEGLDINNVEYIVELYNEYLMFRHQERNVKLSLEKIENVALQSESEIINTNKGVLKRALVGGALLGPAGAVVGGMTGQNKVDKVYRNFLMISYRNNDSLNHIILKRSESDKTISKTAVDFELKAFADKIKSKIPNLSISTTKEL